jgi:hypothetical protein
MRKKSNYERYKQFIDDWPNRDKYFRNLLKESYVYILGQYYKELDIIQSHPHPNEYKEYVEGVKYEQRIIQKI